MPEAFIHHNIDNLQRALDRLSPQVIRRTLTQVAKTAQREMLRRYRRVTNTWRRKPTFAAEYEVSGTTYSVLVGTDDPVFGYVDLGTRPHRIEPKGNYPLRFQWGGYGSYVAKTQPNVLTSNAGGPQGPMVHRWGVNHPGTEARNFTEMIQKEVGDAAYKQTLRLIRKEMDRAFRMNR